MAHLTHRNCAPDGGSSPAARSARPSRPHPCLSKPHQGAREHGLWGRPQARSRRRAPASWGNPGAYSARTGRTEPTITIGKRLAERIRANVTSGVAESREIRSNVEWQLSPRVSVEGSYDNVNDISSSSLGNLGADVRWRMEFE
jgi:hypothetical protein